MIVVMNRIPVNPEYSEAFETRFADRSSLVVEMEGFVAFRLLRPTNPDDPYIVMTMWESHDHFQAWTESESFQQGHARSGQLPREAFLGRPSLEIMEVIQKASSGDIAG